MREGNINERLNDLEAHLKRENPVLLDVIKRFRELDQIARRMGVLAANDSYALQVPWWPMISILGTFSAGKSTFINDYLQRELQTSGNQAVDDKFTVICYSRDEEGRVLPGLALDADVRFPFYGISNEIERVASGEGRRVDAYLQLKTTSSPAVCGKIFIDSPGFDADAQRTSTLRITRHIIDLSDLVLVFFDARHPEPGAMQDTLDHLVRDTISRPDSNKFLFVLNQIDTAAREDNPEQVVGAWQRALSNKGLTAGRFYNIYSETASVPIEDPETRRRFQSKRDADLVEIRNRIEQVAIERAYRIVGALEQSADRLEHEYVPAIQGLISTWSKRVLTMDAIVVAFLIAIVISILAMTGELSVSQFNSADIARGSALARVLAVVAAVSAIVLHFVLRGAIAKRMIKSLEQHEEFVYARALRFNTRAWRSVWKKRPRGWRRRSELALGGIRHAATKCIQQLNDQFTDPSGDKEVPSADSSLSVVGESSEQVHAQPVQTPER